jgi:N-acetylglucosaminyldiphosphoundecaprenol N-acetyl-beta-D-mannosaminyltransferase
MIAETNRQPLGNFEQLIVGGARVARLSIEQTASLMVNLARQPASVRSPLYFTSANGEVLAQRYLSPDFAALIDSADLISADGQPLVIASRLLLREGLPERVATTDLYWVVARMAQERGVSFYLYGAEDEMNRRACEMSKSRFPQLDIRGRSHGYLRDSALEMKLDEINMLAPDILWLALGVPREQEFIRDHGARLANVKMIKTSGGLFDFVAGAKSRAPLWMQKCGMEWAYRLALEPRRLLVRYLTTNPIALMLLFTQTRREDLLGARSQDA